MEFTYSAYNNLLQSLKDHGYSPVRFCDVSDEIEYPAIIRHDVDMDLQKALEIARLEIKNDVKLRSLFCFHLNITIFYLVRT